MRISGLKLLAMLWLTLMFSMSAHANDVETGRIMLRVMKLPSPTSPGVDATVQRTLVREFSRQHPEYRLEPFHMLSIREGASMDEGPLMAIATGIPPHGIYVNFRQSSTYINHGFLEPLEVLYARIHSADPRVRQTGSEGEWLADPAPAEIDAAVAYFKQSVPAPAWPVIYREAEPTRARPMRRWAAATPN